MSDHPTPMALDDLAPETPIYRERLWPSLGMWTFLFAMSISLGIAYAQPFGAFIGWLTFGILSGAIIVGLLVSTPKIEVSYSTLQVGRAKLPISYVGQFRHLDSAATKLARSTNAHADAYLNLRGGISDTFIVEITDVDDPHPYWQFSTRNPEKLAAAIKRSLDRPVDL
jgi:hypothetical protein